MARRPGILAACLVMALATRAGWCADAAPPENAIFPRPMLVPYPTSVAGVPQAVVALGNWKTTNAPTGEFWGAGVDTSAWNGGGGGGRGRGGGGGGGGGNAKIGDYTSASRTSVLIPPDWANKSVIIRFDNGASGDNKLWVNGKEVRTHWGPLMSWSADITPFIKAGEEASITVGIAESGGLSQFSRSGNNAASLLILPRDYLARVHIDTTFDKQYKDATVHLWLTVGSNTSPNVDGRKAPIKIKVSLKDATGAAAAINPDTIDVAPNALDRIYDITVPAPKKWDAEHPNLYTLETDLLGQDGVVAESIINKNIGLRQVEVRGNQFFVNGLEVKFRGIWGNSVEFIKSVNGNHSREKWITDRKLNDADTQGLYILDENPIDFAKFGPEFDPKFGYQWLGFMSDMLERDRDHPSVIMWGMGNESISGPNILPMFKYEQTEDKQRPATFSWANRIPVDQEIPYSIYSSHYPDLNDPNINLGSYTVAKWHSPSLLLQRNPVPVMPVLHDEYSHVVLNNVAINRDANVRNFWGESIHMYWEKMMATQGALGGDIFGLNGLNGSGATENYFVRKAYSPIRIENAPLANPGAGKPLAIPIKNWYDQTNLTEVNVAWAVGGETGSMVGPDVAPHGSGILVVPARAWKDGDKLSLKFSNSAGVAIDEFLLAINPPVAKLPAARGPPPKLEIANGKINITGEHFKVVFAQAKGQIENASFDGKTVLIDGPSLDVNGSGLSYPEWWCDKISAKTQGNEAVVDIKGNYAVFAVSFQVRIDGQGLLTTQYTIDHLPGDSPPPTFSPWDSTSVGGYNEVGVSYLLPNTTSSLSWRRKSLWTVYPNDHIGRPEGTVPKNSNEFTMSKEYIYSAAVTVSDGAVATALSDGRDAVHMTNFAAYRVFPGGVRMGIHNEWNYPDIGLGNHAKPPILVKDGYTNTVYLQLGNGK